MLNFFNTSYAFFMLLLSDNDLSQVVEIHLQRRWKKNVSWLSQNISTNITWALPENYEHYMGRFKVPGYQLWIILMKHECDSKNTSCPSGIEPGSIWSISWLQMPWLLVSPGHQQPWFWICRINGSLYFMGKNSYPRNDTCERKMEVYFLSVLKWIQAWQGS